MSNPPILHPDLARAGWIVETSTAGTAPDTVRNPAVDAFLQAGGDFEVHRTGRSFIAPVPALIKAARTSARMRGKILFDSPKLRIASDLVPGGKCSIDETSYLSGVVTNDISTRQVLVADIRIDGREMCFPGGVIPPLSASACSNHIGVAVLAVDRDGVLRLCVAGSASVVEGGKVTATGAGSCDAVDFEHGEPLAAAAARSAMRELVEETGVHEALVADLRVISFVRNLERGAKPEFIFAARIAGTWADAAPISDEERTHTAGWLDLDLKALGAKGLLEWVEANAGRCGYAVRSSVAAIARTMVN